MRPRGDMAVVLLVGGASRRFGIDKARHVPPGADVPLWRSQLDKLKVLGAEEEILSVAAGGSRFPPPPGVRVIADGVADQGPLGGIATVLEMARADRIFVLAVDMPGVTARDIDFLAEQAPPGKGLVPRRQTHWEPLLAVYPRSLAGVARARLEAGMRSLQGFVDEAERLGWIEAWPVPPEAESWFTNWNHPEDGGGMRPGFASGTS